MPQTNQAQPRNWEQCQSAVQTSRALEIAVAMVQGLNFEMMGRKLSEEKKWTEETLGQVESLYRKFLALNILYPGRKICPTGPVDDFWHAHILDTHAYEADCKVLFGGILHHFPYFGMRGPEDKAALGAAFADTTKLFVLHFGIDPTAGDTEARSCSPQRCP